MAVTPPLTQVLAATVDGCTLVVVPTMANFKLAPAFKQAVQAARLSDSALVVVDMANCRTMDSSFMGTLAGLWRTAGKDGQPALVLINLGPAPAALLKGLGIDRLLKIYPAGHLPDGLGDLSHLTASLQPVEAERNTALDLTALMYDAHETLSRVSPENLKRFQDVLAFLREDLARLQ